MKFIYKESFIINIETEFSSYKFEFDTEEDTENFQKGIIGAMEAGRYNEGFIKLFDSENNKYFIRIMDILSITVTKKRRRVWKW